jgi:hypothetical protein
MWALLRRMGVDCWGQHDWMFKANSRGLWLECRRCGHESPGVELPAPRYRRTQEGAPEACRVGGVVPALRTARATALTAPEARQFGVRRMASRPAATPAWDSTNASSAVAGTDAERRWLQAWRALSSEDREVAERLVAGLTLTRGVMVRAAGEDRAGRMVG